MLDFIHEYILLCKMYEWNCRMRSISHKIKLGLILYMNIFCYAKCIHSFTAMIQYLLAKDCDKGIVIL